MQETDILIVGGGIIGTSIAYHLTKDQPLDVTLLEAQTLAAGASHAAGGMLGAHSEITEFGALADFALAGQKLWTPTAAALRTQTGIDIELRDEPLLQLAYTEAEAATLAELVNQDGITWLNRSALVERVPNIDESVIGAALMPADIHLTPKLAVHAFATAAQQQGVRIQESTRVLHIQKITDGYEVVTNQGTWHAQRVVIASGVWSTPLLQELGLTAEVFPVKGEVLALENHGAPLTHTLFHDQYWLVPRNDREVVIGATKKPYDWSTEVTANGLMTLLHKAQSMLPSVTEMTFKRAWMGFRPQSADKLPYIGVHPTQPNCFVAAGHGRNGILLAPITGKLIADMMLGKPVNKQWQTALRVNR